MPPPDADIRPPVEEGRTQDGHVGAGARARSMSGSCAQAEACAHVRYRILRTHDEAARARSSSTFGSIATPRRTLSAPTRATSRNSSTSLRSTSDQPNLEPPQPGAGNHPCVHGGALSTGARAHVGRAQAVGAARVRALPATGGMDRHGSGRACGVAEARAGRSRRICRSTRCRGCSRCPTCPIRWAAATARSSSCSTRPACD